MLTADTMLILEAIRSNSTLVEVQVYILIQVPVSEVFALSEIEGI
jgi:hypothetical protein